MHPQGHGDVTGLTECGMLCCIMSLAEVIDTVTKYRFEGVDAGSTFIHKNGNTHK